MYAARLTHGPVELAFTDRHGGVSGAPFDSLNLGWSGGDDPDAMAVFLVGLLRGIALQLISTPPPARVKAIIDEAERSTLRALRP